MYLGQEVRKTLLQSIAHSEPGFYRSSDVNGKQEQNKMYTKEGINDKGVFRNRKIIMDMY